ncbi:MAG TPA: polysaccharide biosynthesis tyrosine autokinase [Steroidobacteraceae bacterium]|nr:polysaccharide biosynthesis tyrosine autokinase [Steroidobacteraceae bacterium]
MEEVSAISLQNLWRVIRLRWFTLLFTTALLFGGIAAYVFSLKPAFTAHAVVLLAPVTEELGDAPTTARVLSTTDPFFIRSETAIIASDELARGVIEKLDLAKQPEFAPQPGLLEQLGLRQPEPATAHPWLSNDELTLDAVLNGYQDRLAVFNDGRSKTVDVAFTAASPRLAAAIANTHAEAYLHEQANRRGDSRTKSLGWLKQEVDARAKEARDADARVQQYQLQNNIVTARDSTMVEQRLSQLSGQLVDAKRQLSTQQAQLAEIRAIRAGGDPSNAATLLANDALADLLRSRVQAESEVASLSTRLADSHPTLIKAKQTLASINETLEKQLARVENEAAASTRSWQRQVADLSGAVGSETSNKVSQDRVSSALPALLAEAQVKRTVFETVLNRYQTQLAEHGYSEPTAVIVSRAVAPARPSFPRTSLFLALGAIASLIGGVVMAVIVQALRPGTMGLNQMADAVGLRPLVAIPRFRNESREAGQVKIKDPRLYIESIRSLRHAVYELHSDRDTMVTLFTSVVPSQGKTLVAMSVARALSRSNIRTLFLEMDLRCPAAAKLARVQEPSRGVAAVLEMRANVNDVLLQDETTGLDMLLAERNASHALDKLTVHAFSALMARLRQRYDAIIIDSPPAGLLSDALTLACVADRTIIVARSGETPMPDLAHATRLLRERGATLAGLVLTDVDPRELRFAGKSMKRYVMGMPGPKLSAVPDLRRA